MASSAACSSCGQARRAAALSGGSARRTAVRRAGAGRCCRRTAQLAPAQPRSSRYGAGCRRTGLRSRACGSTRPGGRLLRAARPGRTFTARRLPAPRRATRDDRRHLAPLRRPWHAAWPLRSLSGSSSSFRASSWLATGELLQHASSLLNDGGSDERVAIVAELIERVEQLQCGVNVIDERAVPLPSASPRSRARCPPAQCGLRR
jgi:hypothetical protein